MTADSTSHLQTILERVLGPANAHWLWARLSVDPALCETRERVPRAVIAHSLNGVLLFRSVAAVPAAGRYVEEQHAAGRALVLDHGALRTVMGVDTAALPSGQAAFSRLLAPLGYVETDQYPMPALRMLGHGWRHADLPETIAQFFVSELDVGAFSSAFQAAAARVVGTSHDPLSEVCKGYLARLAETHVLPLDAAIELVTNLASCFGRQHANPRWDDYQTLLAESAEMAWIATEGNVFNHAADRVADVHALAEQQKALGRPMKETVEVSASGRVRQTAYRAATVQRDFVLADGSVTERAVPGSFFEFISRDVDPETEVLDLRFDAANAQGIFHMTRTEENG